MASDREALVQMRRSVAYLCEAWDEWIEYQQTVLGITPEFRGSAIFLQELERLRSAAAEETRPSQDPLRRAREAALAVPGVKRVSLHSANGAVKGVAYDAQTGIEFDVRQDGERWNVNDDNGVDYRSRSLHLALSYAIRANGGILL